MELRIVCLKELLMILSDLLLRLVLPDSRELKWSCPSVRFMTLVPFFERLTTKRLENVLRVLNVIGKITDILSVVIIVQWRFFVKCYFLAMMAVILLPCLVGSCSRRKSIFVSIFL